MWSWSTYLAFMVTKRRKAPRDEIVSRVSHRPGLVSASSTTTDNALDHQLQRLEGHPMNPSITAQRGKQMSGPKDAQAPKSTDDVGLLTSKTVHSTLEAIAGVDVSQCSDV